MSSFHDEAPMSEGDAEEYIVRSCLTLGKPHRVGVELEWLVRDILDPARHIPIRHIASAINATPVHDGYISYEPGGQIEYSSKAALGLIDCVTATTRDVASLRRSGINSGLELAGLGMDPFRHPRRELNHPRYIAMERFFGREGRSGLWLMSRSASIQVCLDAGDSTSGTSGVFHRWKTIHLLGPLFVAMFANSPVVGSRVTGWASTRQAIWSRVDPSRTALISDTHPTKLTDPHHDWARYALNAKVMCIPRGPQESWIVPEGLIFRDWIHQKDTGPTRSDLDYHLSTLFPPIRPRGYIELRMIDAQMGDNWVVPFAVCTTLLDNPHACDKAYAAVERLWRPNTCATSVWRRAARRGVSDPIIAIAARECLRIVIDALPQGSLRSTVEIFAERYSERSRCPADDILDQRGLCRR